MTVIESIVYGIWWYAILTASVLLVLPLVFAACRGLPDRGLSVYRPAGIALAILPVWWFGNVSPLPFHPITIIGFALLVGAISWGLVGREMGILAHLREHWVRLSAVEFVSVVLYIGYLLFRGFNPAIRGTEKPMELAFLNSVIRSDSLPVGDPWFAGEPINYYYFGYVVYGSFAKVTEIPGDIAFNLALASTFAMAVVAAGGLAANAIGLVPSTSRWASGIGAVVAGFLLMFSGNLHAAGQFLRSPRETLQAGWWDGIGWESSRVIQDTGFGDGTERAVITEFPAFSWVLGDLHPHVLTYPWLLAAFALALGLIYSLTSTISLPASVFYSIPVGVGIGVLYSSNTWDVPIAVLVTLIALFLVGRRVGWSVPFVSLMSIVLSSLLTAVPFAINYTAAAGEASDSNQAASVELPLVGLVSGTFGFVDWNRTTFNEILTVHGVFLLLLILVVAGALARSGIRSWTAVFLFLIAAAMLSVVTIALQAAAVILMGVPIIFLLLALYEDPRRETVHTFLYLLVMSALLMVILLEFVFIRDTFGDRMNSVFKMYFQVWALLAVAIGALIPLSIRVLRRYAHVAWSWLAGIGVVGVLAVASIYAPISAYSWTDDFESWKGMSGLRYLDEENEHEAAAIEWLRDNAGSDAVILEAPGCSYGVDHQVPHNRISMATGIPTILGWEGHEFQWRRQQPRLLSEIQERQDHVTTIYEEPLDSDAPGYLTDYGITHIVVGVHETQGYENCNVGPPYAEEGLDNLGRTIWQPVFQSGPMVILAPDPEGFVAN